MARNRSDVDREAKREAILDRATPLFIDEGYDGTSMAAIARAAGVAPNTLYWYFADKDDLLVAVLDRELIAALASTPLTAPLPELLLHAVGVLDRLNQLTVAVHARTGASPAIAEWHDRFHAATDAWTLAAIRAHLQREGRGLPSDADLAPVPRLWAFAIEGMVAHALSEPERAALCALLVRQVNALADASPTPT